MKEQERQKDRLPELLKKEWTIYFYRGNKCEIIYKKECVELNTPVDNYFFFLLYLKEQKVKS